MAVNKHIYIRTEYFDSFHFSQTSNKANDFDFVYAVRIVL